jgi:2-C-methyl-D-erythritol 2,4-cyclodiphosphate synthase
LRAKKSSRTRKRRGERKSGPKTANFKLPAHKSQPSLRIGFGNDIHPLVSGRELILGGVTIPFEKGPAGHSDGDALAHALTDALLGAAALGDIGTHFPDSSPEWHDASSLIFLENTRRLLDRTGFAIVNVDTTISLQRPKLRPYIQAMRSKIAEALGIKATQVSVKAKTGEGLDSVGRGEAIRAEAVALLSTSAKI